MWLTRGTAVSPSSKSSGSWDSIHTFEVHDRARSAQYKQTSTVILSLGTSASDLGSLDLSGNMVRQVIEERPFEDDGSHVANIGKVGNIQILLATLTGAGIAK
jgi:capping protein (actin filament) muscle Z-line, beta